MYVKYLERVSRAKKGTVSGLRTGADLGERPGFPSIQARLGSPGPRHGLARTRARIP